MGGRKLFGNFFPLLIKSALKQKRERETKQNIAKVWLARKGKGNGTTDSNENSKLQELHIDCIIPALLNIVVGHH